MQEQKKHLPRPYILFRQIAGIIGTSMFSFGMSLFYNGDYRILSVTILWLFVVIQVFLVVFSLFWGWNIPIIVDCDGIAIKRKKMRIKKYWKDMVEIKKYDYNLSRYNRAVLVCSDSTKIVFEIPTNIEKSIVLLCNDEVFVNKFKCALDIQGHLKINE